MTAIIRRSPTRTLTVFKPFYRPFDLLDEVESMGRDMFDTWRPLFGNGSQHNMDVYREKDDLVVKVELPGIKKKDLDISLEEDFLTIKAEKKREEVTKEADHYISERQFGHYSRSIKLPFHVDAEKISATFKNGLLEMRIPKAEEAENKRIEIKTK